MSPKTPNTYTAELLTIDTADINDYRASIYIPQLIDCITYHNTRYYIYADPIITDQQRDTLFTKLKNLEEMYPQYIYPHSPTQKLVGQIAEGYSKATHMYPLKSLGNTYNADDIRDRVKQITKLLPKDQNIGNSTDDGAASSSGDINSTASSLSYIVEPKFDGSSVELIYRYGQLTQGITRGDGVTGEEITSNIKMLRNLPAYIPSWKDTDVVHLRGEVVMPLSQFDALNTELDEAGEKVFANPRNACAGTLRLLDSSEVYRRGLVIFVFEVLGEYVYDQTITNDTTMLQHLSEIGLPIYDWTQQVGTTKELLDICADQELKKKFDQANVEFDGLVIKVNEYIYRTQMGSTEHHPRRAIAYKYPTTQLPTQIIGIDYQVGRFGTITPVAVLEPLAIGGTIVNKVSMHNFDRIAERDIRIGDTIYVQRSGEVIPYIVDVNYSKRPAGAQKVEKLDICPSCQTKVESSEGLVALRCKNIACHDKLVQQIEHATSKHCLDIKGLGTSLIELLVSSGYIHAWWHIFVLAEKKSELRALPGVDTKKIETIIDGADIAKSKDLWRWIHALGILYIGKKISQDLAKHYYIWISDRQSSSGAGPKGTVEGSCEDGTSLDSSVASLPLNDYPLSSLYTYFQDSEYIESIFGLGKQSVESLSNWTQTQEAQKLLAYISSHSIYIASLDPKLEINHIHTTNGALSGKKVCVTGSFGITRDELAEIVQQQGGSVVSSVSKNTSILMAGEKSGSKLTKAQELGVEVWDEETLKNELGLDYISLSSTNKKTAPVEQLGLFG